MIDYTMPARQGERPWSSQLDLGDILTSHQAAAIDETRLRDFGYRLEYLPERGDGAQIVVQDRPIVIAQQRHDGAWHVYNRVGYALRSRKTQAGALALAKRQFPGEQIVVRDPLPADPHYGAKLAPDPSRLGAS